MAAGNDAYRRFWCWSPDLLDEADGSWIEETHPRYAAERYTHEYHNREPSDVRDGFEVSVRDKDDEVSLYSVSVDFSPTFYASEVDE